MTRKGAYIKPNQELRDYIVLAKVFDLSNPGTYTVSAKASFDSLDSGAGDQVDRSRIQQHHFHCKANGIALTSLPGDRLRRTDDVSVGELPSTLPFTQI